MKYSLLRFCILLMVVGFCQFCFADKLIRVPKSNSWVPTIPGTILLLGRPYYFGSLDIDLYLYISEEQLPLAIELMTQNPALSIKDISNRIYDSAEKKHIESNIIVLRSSYFDIGNQPIIKSKLSPLNFYVSNLTFESRNTIKIYYKGYIEQKTSNIKNNKISCYWYPKMQRITPKDIMFNIDHRFPCFAVTPKYQKINFSNYEIYSDGYINMDSCAYLFTRGLGVIAEYIDYQNNSDNLYSESMNSPICRDFYSSDKSPFENMILFSRMMYYYIPGEQHSEFIDNLFLKKKDGFIWGNNIPIYKRTPPFMSFSVYHLLFLACAVIACIVLILLRKNAFLILIYEYVAHRIKKSYIIFVLFLFVTASIMVTEMIMRYGNQNNDSSAVLTETHAGKVDIFISSQYSFYVYKVDKADVAEFGSLIFQSLKECVPDALHSHTLPRGDYEGEQELITIIDSKSHRLLFDGRLRGRYYMYSNKKNYIAPHLFNFIVKLKREGKLKLIKDEKICKKIHSIARSKTE